MITFLPVYISAFFINKLDVLRYKIDIIDKSIYNLICFRMKYCKETVKYKTNIHNPKREQYIINRLKNINKHNNLKINETLIDDIWSPLLQYSKYEQIMMIKKETQ